MRESQDHAGAARLNLPPALEARIAALEANAAQRSTATAFDVVSWIWMILLGALLPLALLIAGWWA